MFNIVREIMMVRRGEQPLLVQYADDLAQSLPPPAIEAILARYATDAMRVLTAPVSTLPADRARAAGGRHADQLRQIHSNHIGDTLSGKRKRLPAPLQEVLTTGLRPFPDRFGYRRAA